MSRAVVDRRAIVGGLLVTGTAAIVPPAKSAASGRAYVMYVGGYTKPQRDGRGEGIDVYAADAASAWVHRQRVKTSNAHYLLADDRRNLLFCANADETYLTSFRIDPATGELALLGTTPTGGSNSVYLTFDPSRRFVLSANYGSGDVSVFPVDDRAGLGERTDLFKLAGTPGPHRVQQNASEPHQVLYDPSGAYIVVPDKGVDRIHVLRLDGGTGRLSLASECLGRSGTGPRHAVFHPSEPILYVLSELASTVTSYAFDPGSGKLTPRQIVTTLPDTFFGNSIASEICLHAPSRTLYASNRGHDTVAAFRIGHAGGLAPFGWTPTGGGNPRFMTLAPDGAALIVLNQDSDTIVRFPIGRDGRLGSGRTVARTGSPAVLIARRSA